MLLLYEYRITILFYEYLYLIGLASGNDRALNKARMVRGARINIDRTYPQQSNQFEWQDYKVAKQSRPGV